MIAGGVGPALGIRLVLTVAPRRGWLLAGCGHVAWKLLWLLGCLETSICSGATSLVHFAAECTFGVRSMGVSEGDTFWVANKLVTPFRQSKLSMLAIFLFLSLHDLSSSPEFCIFLASTHFLIELLMAGLVEHACQDWHNVLLLRSLGLRFFFWFTNELDKEATCQCWKTHNVHLSYPISWQLRRDAVKWR